MEVHRAGDEGSEVGVEGVGKVSPDPTARRDVMGLRPAEFGDLLIE
jgi:hypothetical protein